MSDEEVNQNEGIKLPDVKPYSGHHIRKEDGFKIGPKENGNGVYCGHEISPQLFVNVCGYWISRPYLCFRWQKLVYAHIWPLLAEAFILGFNSIDEESPLRFLGVEGHHNEMPLVPDYADKMRAGADEVVIFPELDHIEFSGGVLEGVQICASSNFRDIFQDSQSDDDWLISTRIEANQAILADWKAETSFLQGRYDIERQFSVQACNGVLQVKGRVRDALAEPQILESDVFFSDVKIERNGNSIWVGETRVWNVEVRINPKYAPRDLNLRGGGEPAPMAPEDYRNSTFTKRQMAPNSESENRFQQWCANWLKARQVPPKNFEMFEWGKDNSITRESMRGAIRRLPDGLKRQRGNGSS